MRGALPLAACLLVSTLARAQEEAPKEAPKKEAPKEAPKEAERAPTEKPNEEKRTEDEGKETALPSVAGRPIRRYAQRHVFELGGAVSLVKANAFTQLGVSPSFGWFFIDYVQLSLLPAIDYVKTATAAARSRFSILIEPSFHAHVAGPVFAFFGAGGGAAYEKESGAGLAIAPRIGLSFLIGGSGILKVSAAYVYTATRRTQIEDGTNDKNTSTFNLQLGATIAW